jgi:hypothetical protein
VDASTGKVTAVIEEARLRSASTRLHGSQRVATKAHVKKTAGGAPGAWCGGLPAMASLVVSVCRARGAKQSKWSVDDLLFSPS